MNTNPLEAVTPIQATSPVALGQQNKWFILVQVGCLIAVCLIFPWITNNAKKKADLKKKEFVDCLQIGDMVQTSTGIIGTIIYMDENTVEIKSGQDPNNSFITVVKASIISKL